MTQIKLDITLLSFICKTLAALLFTCMTITAVGAEKQQDRDETQIEDITLEEEEFIETDEDYYETPEDLYGFINHYFIEDNTTTNIAIATLSSLGIPGAGQALNLEFKKGATHLAFWGANEYMARSFYKVNRDRRNYAESLNKAFEYKSIESVSVDLHSSMALSTRYFSAFDAYRETSILSRRAGGRIPISKETLTDLSLAPFTTRYVTKPLVFTPIFAVGAFYFGRGSSNSENEELTKFVMDGTRSEEVAALGAVQHEFVAVGEEVVFRGILNTEMMRNLGVYPGIAVSSVIFGVSHSSAGTSSSLLATMYGMYLGFVHYYYGYQLGPGVALHFWWNTIIYTASSYRPERVTIPVGHIVF